MSLAVRVAPEAEAEFEACVKWYGERANLRDEFIAAIDEAIAAIAAAPDRFPSWSAGSPYRKYLLRRFPYAVLFRTLPDAVVILAFDHTPRRPGYWLRQR